MINTISEMAANIALLFEAVNDLDDRLGAIEHDQAQVGEIMRLRQENERLRNALAKRAIT